MEAQTSDRHNLFNIEMMHYRVVEINSAYDHIFGVGKGWIYVSNEIYDYSTALNKAIEHERRLPHTKTWVEALRR